MPEIPKGDFVEVIDDDGNKYFLAHIDKTFSCTCSEWKSQCTQEALRTCKHLTKYRGLKAERDRLPGLKIASSEQSFQKVYVSDSFENDEPTTVEDFAATFASHLDLRNVSRYMTPTIIYFTDHAAFMQLETYPDPEYTLNAEDPGFPPELFLRRVEFVQEEEYTEELSELVDELFTQLGWHDQSTPPRQSTIKYQESSCPSGPPTLKSAGNIQGVTRAQTNSARVVSLANEGKDAFVCEQSHVAAWYAVVANSGEASKGLKLTLRVERSAQDLLTPISASAQHFNPRAHGSDPGKAMLRWQRIESRFTRDSELIWTAEIDFEFKHLFQIGFLFCPVKSGQVHIEIDLQPLDSAGTSQAHFTATIQVEKLDKGDEPEEVHFQKDICHYGVDKRRYKGVLLTPWGYFCDFENDINSALQKMRQLEFETCFSQDHISIDEALKNGSDEASCGIMKIRSVGDKRAEGVTCPVWKKSLIRIFGTDKPTLSMLGKDINDAYETMSSEWNFFGWAESFYIVFYAQRVLQGKNLLVPSTIFFGGWMYDL